MPTQQIPGDIWLHVAQFLPRSILRNLLSVNRTFFYLEMGARYRVITLFQLDKQMMGLLERLRSPIVRDRVRVLRIRPYFIEEMLNVQDENQSQSLASTSHVMWLLQDCFRSFKNLLEYQIIWYELPLITDLSIQLLRAPFLFQPHIRSLYIEASLVKLGALLSMRDVPLTHLEQLHLSVRHSAVHEHEHESSDFDCSISSISSDVTRSLITLASFTNSTSPTLRSFSFSSRRALDFSVFFRALTRFSLLKDMTISVPSTPPHLGDPSTSLRQFLDRHAGSLKHLTLKGHFIDEGSEWESSFRDWAKRVFTDDGGDNEKSVGVGVGVRTPYTLESLTIQTNFYHPDVAALCARRFRGCLRDLDLTGRYLTFDQVKRVVDALAYSYQTRTRLGWGTNSNSDIEYREGLKVLRLGPVTLSPQLVDMLAEKLPGLEELDVRMKDAVPHKDHHPVYSGMRLRKVRSQDPKQVEMFFDAMRMRTYPNWKLRSVSVWKPNAKLQFQSQYVEAFKECVPSLRQSQTKLRI